MAEADNRRREPRTRIELRVTVHVGGGGYSIGGVSHDLSKNGIFVSLKEKLGLGQRVELLIESPVDRQLCVVNGVVAHVVLGTGVGIEFQHPSAVARERLQQLLATMRRA